MFSYCLCFNFDTNTYTTYKLEETLKSIEISSKAELVLLSMSKTSFVENEVLQKEKEQD